MYVPDKLKFPLEMKMKDILGLLLNVLSTFNLPLMSRGITMIN